MNKNKILLTGLLGLFAPLASAQSLSLGEMPYKHPKACESLLDTRGFNVFYNQDCSVLFLAPAPIEKPFNEVKLEANVALCDANSSRIQTLNALTSTEEQLTAKLNEAVEEGNDKKLEKILGQLEKLSARITEHQKEYAKFSQIHASTIFSAFDNSIDGDDLHNFYMQNFYILQNLGNKAPYITQVQPENSIYSFSFARPAYASEEASTMLGTTIPGLEMLVQQSSKQSDVAHVKADRVSGKTQLSLMSTCSIVHKIADKWQVNNDAFKNEVTVNRSYDIPMKIGYGIKAHLNSTVAASVLADLVANTSGHGLSKSQIYKKMLSVTGSEVFTIKIDTDVALSSDERVALEHDIRQRLVDRFLLYFEMRGDLADLQPVEVKAPEGGIVPVDYVGTHCWSKSGFLGIGGSSGCRDYIYTVKEWREGKTTAQIHDYLAVELDIIEQKQINDVILMPMSTLFYEKSGGQNELF